MNQQELLKELGVSYEELQKLLAKVNGFLTSLDEHELKIVKRSLPTLTEAVRSFGHDVTPDELRKLFEGASDKVPVTACYFLLRRNA